VTRLRSTSLLPGPRRYIYIALAILIGTGIFFRLYDLGTKYYYVDEVVSSLRESGHTEKDFARLFDGKIHTVTEISKYLSDRSTSLASVFASLAAEDPQHPPLFYIANRYATEFFGDSQSGRRYLAAIFGILAIAAVFWLTLELSGSLLQSAVCAALIAISPFDIIYSQQNREYSAWLFFIAFSSAMLLRAMKESRWWQWVFFAISIAAALYTDVLILYHIVSLTIFLLLYEGKVTRRIVAFVTAIVAALILYIPWLFVLYRGAHTITGWVGPLKYAVSFQVYISKLLFNTAAVFFDAEYIYIALLPIAALVLVIVAFSIVNAMSKGSRIGRYFMGSITFVPAAFFFISDLYAHTSRATAPRYLVPVWLGIQLMVAFTLTQSWSLHGSRRKELLALTTLAFIFACGAASDIINAPAYATSATAEMVTLGPESKAINASRHPLVVFVHDRQAWDITVAMLATVLKPSVQFQLIPSLSSAYVKNPQRGFFLYQAGPATLSALKLQTRGNWQAVQSQTLGNTLVLQLRKRGNADRNNHKTTNTAGAELWWRQPDQSSTTAHAQMSTTH
jgi:uncharacterized membrane protein